MSKVSSQSSYPTYSGGSVSIGDSKATTGLQNGALVSNYKMSKSEEDIYNYALETLSTILPELNIFDNSTRDNILSQVQAQKNSGIDAINDLYNNSLTDLQNNSASRFGNLDNSIFTNSLSKLENNRAKAVSSFAQDILAKQSELEADELTKRYALVNLLSGMSDNIYNKALNALNMSLGSSSSANTYNSNLYNALSKMNSTNSAYSGLGNIFSTIASLTPFI